MDCAKIWAVEHFSIVLAFLPADLEVARAHNSGYNRLYCRQLWRWTEEYRKTACLAMRIGYWITPKTDSIARQSKDNPTISFFSLDNAPFHHFNYCCWTHFCALAAADTFVFIYTGCYSPYNLNGIFGTYTGTIAACDTFTADLRNTGRFHHKITPKI